MKRQLSLSVMEDDQGYLTLMAMLHDRCNDEYVHEAVSMVELDELPASKVSDWVQVAGRAMAEVLGLDGEVHKDLIETMKEGQHGCAEGH